LLLLHVALALIKTEEALWDGAIMQAKPWSYVLLLTVISISWNHHALVGDQNERKSWLLQERWRSPENVLCFQEGRKEDVSNELLGVVKTSFLVIPGWGAMVHVLGRYLWYTVLGQEKDWYQWRDGQSPRPGENAIYVKQVVVDALVKSQEWIGPRGMVEPVCWYHWGCLQGRSR